MRQLFPKQFPAGTAFKESLATLGVKAFTVGFVIDQLPWGAVGRGKGSAAAMLAKTPLEVRRITDVETVVAKRS